MGKIIFQFTPNEVDMLKMNPSHLLLFFTVTLLLITSCQSEQVSHPCDTCRPCETCVRNENNGTAACQPTSHATQRCVGLKVIWFNSCIEPEETAVTCNSDMVCEEHDGGATCACPNLWTGESCDECPPGVDITSNCSACQINYDPQTDCQSCIGNRDIETGCTECLNHWSGENCDVCPDGFDEKTGCADCRNHWRGDACKTCPVNFTIESDCTQCANQWTGENCTLCPEQLDPASNCSTCKGTGYWTGDNCDVCPANFTVESDCTECATNWLGNDCNTCPSRFTVESNCTECTGHFTGDNCSICPPNFTEESNCIECRNHWEGENCDVCPAAFEADSNCTECANHWTGAHCDVCPEHFTVESDCTACIDDRTGDDCDECIGNWTGDNCDVCPDNFTAESGCTECANQWTGASCDVCPTNYDASNNCSGCANRWEGASCDVCPANWDAEFNCALCANHWTGLDCDVCLVNYTAESNCLECANHYYGTGCNICPINFTTRSDCAECANHWTGDNCDVCPENFSELNNCSECATHWTGDDCDVCPNHWAGDNCDECPAMFTEASDCLECANGWTGDNCDECPNQWTGASCDICPSGFGGEDCDEVAARCIRFVDGDNSGANATGLSWTAAFSEIQSAIDSATAAMTADGGTNCEVWIKQNVLHRIYKSAASDTLVIPSGIALVGGFDGTESSTDSWPLNVRSSINCSSDTLPEQRSDICVTIHDSTNVVIANIQFSTGIVGLDAKNAQISLESVAFEYFENTGDGGAIVSDASELNIQSTAMLMGTAQRGTGIFAINGSEISIAGAGWYALVAETAGSGVYLDDSTLTCDTCTFSAMTLLNDGATGAAIHSTGSTLYLESGFLYDTTIDGDGGAGGHMYFDDSSWEVARTVLSTIHFTAPTPAFEGVYIANVNSDGRFINNVATNGDIPCARGFLYNENSDLQFINSRQSESSFSATCADSGIIYIDNPTAQTVQIANSILWGLSGTSPIFVSPATTAPGISVTYTIVEGGYAGEGNIDVPYVTGHELDLDGDFPGIDAGNGDLAPEFDRSGGPRTDIAGVANTGTGTPSYTDIGPYEYRP